MNSSFHIPSCFDPARSLFGRRLHAQMRDRRRAESVYIVAAAAIALVLLLAHIVAWALMQPMSDAESLALSAAGLTAGLLFALLCIVGRRPAATVRVDDEEIRVVRGREAIELSYDAIHSISIIDAQLYHRHYARYASTRAFVHRVYPELLLIEWAAGHLVIGVRPADLHDLDQLLQEGISQANHPTQAHPAKQAQPSTQAPPSTQAHPAKQAQASTQAHPSTQVV